MDSDGAVRVLNAQKKTSCACAGIVQTLQGQAEQLAVEIGPLLSCSAQFEDDDVSVRRLDSCTFWMSVKSRQW